MRPQFRYVHAAYSFRLPTSYYVVNLLNLLTRRLLTEQISQLDSVRNSGGSFRPGDALGVADAADSAHCALVPARPCWLWLVGTFSTACAAQTA